MSTHNRRERYWQYYELAKEVEASHLKRTLIEVIRENPCPRQEDCSRGRPPIHSKQKLDFACLLMMADNRTYRGIESDLRDMRTPWDSEPIPDHTTPVRHLQTLPKDWLDLILAETARRCIKEMSKATGPLGADSTVGYGIRYISDCSCSKEQTASGDSQSETAAATIRQSQHAIFAKTHLPQKATHGSKWFG